MGKRGDGKLAIERHNFYISCSHILLRVLDLPRTTSKPGGAVKRMVIPSPRNRGAKQRYVDPYIS